MKKLTLAAAAFVAALAIPAVASAAPGYTTGSVHLRSGPGTTYQRLTTLPAGAQIDIGGCSSWCQVSWRGYHGWIASSYVDIARYDGPRYYGPHYYRGPHYYDYGWDRYSRWDRWDRGPYYRFGYRQPRGGLYFGFGL